MSLDSFKQVNLGPVVSPTGEAVHVVSITVALSTNVARGAGSVPFRPTGLTCRLSSRISVGGSNTMMSSR